MLYTPGEVRLSEFLVKAMFHTAGGTNHNKRRANEMDAKGARGTFGGIHWL